MTKEELQIEFSGNHGFAVVKTGVVTFEIDGNADFEREDKRVSQFQQIYQRYASENMSMRIGEYNVPLWGNRHNLYPQEVHALISDNKLMPGIIQKRIDFLFGKGPILYKNNENGERIQVQDAAISDWLESWETSGYEDYRDYLRSLITDYYHVKTCVSQYHFRRARRLGEQNSIIALSYIGADEARLATTKEILLERIKQQDCDHVIVGDWFVANGREMQVYPRFNPKEPLRKAEAIAFNSEKTFGKWVYAYNDWFAGLYEWIKASNLTPRYLNSYLKNALNAHIHCKIPAAWYGQNKTILERMCNENCAAGPNDKLISEFMGIKLLDEQGKAFRFNENMILELIKLELEKITTLMSGEGKNQGKLYATLKIGQEGWEFEEFPSKFKDYFESVLKYDRRADEVVLAGIGINSSITNVEKDGVISKSGSEVYYNYIVYLNTLSFPEYFICKEINRAIQMNFPRAKTEGIRLGFNIEIPSKQSEISPNDRLTAQNPV
ncbi:MAG: hypothetical protein LBS50_08565 [Prevotellaceae bacterium]|jgi:hypothetical protein|nr:hypothetical protein [Prevotellaceae bacterium]